MFNKKRLCWLSFKAFLDKFSRGFCVCYHVLKANGEDKNGGQVIVPAENRTCPPGLEEREGDSFRNSAWLYIPYMLLGRQHCQA